MAKGDRAGGCLFALIKVTVFMLVFNQIWLAVAQILFDSGAFSLEAAAVTGVGVGVVGTLAVMKCLGSLIGRLLASAADSKRRGVEEKSREHDA